VCLTSAQLTVALNLKRAGYLSALSYNLFPVMQLNQGFSRNECSASTSCARYHRGALKGDLLFRIQNMGWIS
jgi:hypothetical protein